MLVREVPFSLGAFFRAENKFWVSFLVTSQVIMTSGVPF